METDDDIVGEDSRWRLYRPTPLRWKDVKLKMFFVFLNDVILSLSSDHLALHNNRCYLEGELDLGSGSTVTTHLVLFMDFQGDCKI